MRAILVMGWRGHEVSAEPVLIYCGLDGALANRSAAEARATGGFRRIGKLVNPSWIPMPAVPDHLPATPMAIAPAPPADPEPKVDVDRPPEEPAPAESNKKKAKPAEKRRAQADE